MEFFEKIFLSRNEFFVEIPYNQYVNQQHACHLPGACHVAECTPILIILVF